jgi:signal transduction histidine kinase/ActR/RegA family two-component response regulator
MNKIGISPWPRRISLIASGLVVSIGLVVLIGWVLNLEVVKGVISGGQYMKPLTAFNFLLLGAALYCSSSAGVPPLAQRTTGILQAIGQICAGTVVLIGMIKLGRYLGIWSLDLDGLFLGKAAPPTSAAVSLSFILLGCALFLAKYVRAFLLFQFMVLTVIVISWLALSHYVYGGAELFFYSRMAIHTSLTFLILSTGILCLRPDLGLTLVFASDTVGGILSRRLLIPIIVLPIAMGWLRLEAERAGLFEAEAATALSGLIGVIIFAGLVWATAAVLNKTDLKRRAAEENLRDQINRLELLRQITNATGEHEDLQGIFRMIIHSLEDRLPVDFGCVGFYDPVASALRIGEVGDCNPPLKALKQTQFVVSDEERSLFLEGKLLYQRDISQCEFPFRRQLMTAGLRSVVFVPLIVEGKLFAAMVVARRGVDSFSNSDCEFLKYLGEHASLAVHQIQLYNSLRRAYDDLRSTQQVLTQQERLRALGQMAAGIGHDISNSVSPVVLSLEALLRTERYLSPKARGSLEMVKRAMDDVTQTLLRMREFYRRSDPQPKLQPVRLNDMVMQTVELTRARWNSIPQRKGLVIRVSTELSSDIPMIAGIENEIREALTNLIFNAVDAMPQGGLITIRTGLAEARQVQGISQNHERIYLEVSDTGTGMDEETLRRCVEPFFTTKGEQGTGLGLATVYGVAERHGAEVRIKSTLGKGTTISLIFAATSVTPAMPAGNGPSMQSVPQRILVIDDDPLLLSTLAGILSTDGHSVITANGGQAGIEVFASRQKSKEPFEIVITDLSMPNIDGKKVASTVKEISPRVPVILLTGWGYEPGPEEELPPHVDFILSKPSRLGDLRRAIALCQQRNRAA